jgi:hypothetical protein
MNFFETLTEVCEELPPGATLRATPKRDVTRKPRPPATLYAAFNELRGQLPRTRMTLEDVIALRQEHELHQTAQIYLDALFGPERL